MNFSKFQIIFGIEVVTVMLASLGIVPREAVLFLTGLLAFYLLFAPVREAALFFILSIPLFVAIPITVGFDTMSNWRILLALLFIRCLFAKARLSLRATAEQYRLSAQAGGSGVRFAEAKTRLATRVHITGLLRHFVPRNDMAGGKLYFYVALFFLAAFLSLINAESVSYGLRKIIFLANAMMVFAVIMWGFGNPTLKEIKKIQIYSIFSLVISLIIGYVQILWVFFIPLYPFWQWWVNRVISVFYGNNLAFLLSYSNTWFSYYEGSLPTLRIFSVFPDSHSFALFSLIGLIPVTCLWFSGKKKNLYVILGLFSLLSIVLSGSRGIWVSAIMLLVLLVIIYLAIRFVPSFFKGNKKVLLPFFTVIALFFLLFPVSSFILSGSRMGNVSNGDAYESLSFKRAKSVVDFSETSNRGRMDIWKRTLRSFKKNPILGVGIGNYPVVLGESLSASRRGASAHNLYFDIVAEIGLLGFAAFMLVFWELLKKAWKLFRNYVCNYERNYGAIFIFYFLWIMAYGLFDVVLLNDKVLLFFITQVAVLYLYRDANIRMNTNYTNTA